MTLEPVARVDREAFLQMAGLYFRELNSQFVPSEDWSLHYFERILGNSKLSLCWVVMENIRSGFILFGLEDHIFLPQPNGVIYELYISPEFRRRGLAAESARMALEELQRHSPVKMQLEIMKDNRNGGQFWVSLGFEKVSERWVLKNKKA